MERVLSSDGDGVERIHRNKTRPGAGVVSSIGYTISLPRASKGLRHSA
jgi:hypothetical protein